MFDSKKTLESLQVGTKNYKFYSLIQAESQGLTGSSRLPYSLKIVLENLLRQHAEGRSDGSDIRSVMDWLKTRSSREEIAFLPTRMVVPESSGVPLFGDLAAMRESVVALGGQASSVNPVIPIDFFVDHSVMVDVNASPDAAIRNQSIEIERNAERYSFIRWVSQAFDNLRVFPPGSGICHQINLEYLAQVVWTREELDYTLAFPDSLIGTDSHTAMINSLGVFGWGVGGLEGGATALGEPISMLVPEVYGCRLTGRLAPGVTATDLVLTITQILRNFSLAGKFVEFFGPGVDELALPDRSTVANMSPESGATMGFFPIDSETLRFLRLTGRSTECVDLVEAYAKAQGLWRDASTPQAEYSQIINIDLSNVEPSISGPKRPQDRLALGNATSTFQTSFPKHSAVKSSVADSTIQNGDVIIAAITSCTNTSNPVVMMGAGLLARNAERLGLKSKPWVKTSLSPGSRVVADYLSASGLQLSLDALGFNIVGFGCMTCMGNSGPISPPIAESIQANDIVAVAVLSGNRNFEGRIHPNARANFLASPPLVVAYAIAGSILLDLTKDPLGLDRDGNPVYLRDIWPDPDEVRQLIDDMITPKSFLDRYAKIFDGPQAWNSLPTNNDKSFHWDVKSTFIRRPPFFENVGIKPEPIKDISGARVLGMFGDMLTTDHISPIGTISIGTPAAEYLNSLGIKKQDYVNYAARRLNHDVMIRGTFANIRLRNEITPDIEGSSTRHYPSGEQMSIPKAAELYQREGIPLVIIAGREYGAGSSRDWAAKGTQLLGVRAVIGESFERIHRSNLLCMGVMPLEFMNGLTRESLRLNGSEIIDISGIEAARTPRKEVICKITRNDGSQETITLLTRLDTKLEVEYFFDGGIMNYVLRRRLLNKHY